MKTKIKKIAKKMMPEFYNKLGDIKRNKILDKFKKEYPNTKIFKPIHKNDRKLHSQDNQDFIVYENFFKDKKDGFFVI